MCVMKKQITGKEVVRTLFVVSTPNTEKLLDLRPFINLRGIKRSRRSQDLFNLLNFLNRLKYDVMIERGISELPTK